MQVRAIVVLVLVHIAFASIASTKKDPSSDVIPTGLNQTQANNTIRAAIDHLQSAENTRRAGKKKDRSTSSSSGEKDIDSKTGDNSLNTGSSDESDEKNKYEAKLNDGIGWRKWHRKCTPCPIDMVKKWKDPSISWICGAYQRARRSFKSECLMHYRNCQDGTMFVKIHDHRCANSTGSHFFYEYKVRLSDAESDNTESSETQYSDDTDTDSDTQLLVANV